MNKEIELREKKEETRATRYFQPVLTNNTVIIPAKRLQEEEVVEALTKTVENQPLEGKKIDETDADKVSLIDSVKMDFKVPVYTNLLFDEGEDATESILEEVEIDEPKMTLKDLFLEEVKAEEEKAKAKEQEILEAKVDEFIKEIEEAREVRIEETAEKKLSEGNTDELVGEKLLEGNIDEPEVGELKIEEIIIEEAKEAVDALNIQKEQLLTSPYGDNNIQKDVTRKMDLPLLESAKVGNIQTETVPHKREIVENLKEMKTKLFLLASNAKKPVRICVNKKVFLMGSDYANMDCVIRNNRYISRCHAKIYYESACYFIEDVGSMNGTYINGIKLAEGIKYKLETGDVINLADCKFEVDIKE